MKDEEVRAAVLDLLKSEGGSMLLGDFVVKITQKTGENRFVLSRVVDGMRRSGEIVMEGSENAESVRLPT